MRGWMLSYFYWTWINSGVPNPQRHPCQDSRSTWRVRPWSRLDQQQLSGNNSFLDFWTNSFVKSDRKFHEFLEPFMTPKLFKYNRQQLYIFDYPVPWTCQLRFRAQVFRTFDHAIYKINNLRTNFGKVIKIQIGINDQHYCF